MSGSFEHFASTIVEKDVSRAKRFLKEKKFREFQAISDDHGRPVLDTTAVLKA